MHFPDHCRAEQLFNFLNHHSVEVLSAVVFKLNRGDNHCEIAASIKMDAGQFSRFAKATLVQTWTVRNDLQPIIDMFVERTRRNAESAKGQKPGILQLAERG
jgi:hypothetical protein